jgi:hypothetical protein
MVSDGGAHQTNFHEKAKIVKANVAAARTVGWRLSVPCFHPHSR